MMKSVHKQLLLPLMVLLPLAQSNILEAKKRSGIGEALCWIGGAIAGGLIGTAVYNAFQSPSDSEEISSGQELLNKARNLQSKYANQYKQDCSYILGGGARSNELIHSIMHHGHRRSPFSHYVSTLNDNNARVQSMTSSLINKKNHLFERKMEIAAMTSSEKMSREQRAAYSDLYEKLICSMTTLIEILQAMSNDLHKLETEIRGLPEYREEQLRDHIERLENKLDRMNRPTVIVHTPPVVPCWYEPAYAPIELRPAQPIYVEPAIVIQSTQVIDPVPQPEASWGIWCDCSIPL